MGVRGITLDAGSVVVLSLDGTMVYIEAVCPTHASVVALPEQPTARADDRVFTPGKVGIKKISPFSTTDRVVPVIELSARNKEFIGTYEKLREQHGAHYIARSPEEEAAMSVRKAQPSRASKSTGTGKRALKRAAGKNYLRRCATCNEQPGHPNHPNVHEFVPASPLEVPGKSDQVVAASPRAKRVAPSAAAAPTRYTLVSTNLTAAKAQPRGDKFNDGNRSHRVVCALAGLPDKTGTLDEVIGALLADGKTPPANPQKVVRRTLNQLTKPDFGACVSTSGATTVEDDGDE